MKQWIMEFDVKDEDNFEEIVLGTKKIETRGAGPKYEEIKIGDEMLFVCDGKKLSKKVIDKKLFDNIDEMVKIIPFKDIMPNVNSVDEMKKVYSTYPGYIERIKEYGIYAFYLGD